MISWFRKTYLTRRRVPYASGSANVRVCSFCFSPYLASHTAACVERRELFRLAAERAVAADRIDAAWERNRVNEKY